MGFSLDPNMVEGNLFKTSGKWYSTVELDYSGCDWDAWDIWRETRKAYTNGGNDSDIPKGMFLIVINPYTKNYHPIMVTREFIDIKGEEDYMNLILLCPECGYSLVTDYESTDSIEKRLIEHYLESHTESGPANVICPELGCYETADNGRALINHYLTKHYHVIYNVTPKEPPFVRCPAILKTTWQNLQCQNEINHKGKCMVAF